MRSFDWSEGLSRACHEAGHVLAGYLLDLRVLSSKLPPAGGGGETEIDFGDDQRKRALVSFAGLHCQQKFDQQHVTSTDWVRERYDDSASDRSDAIFAVRMLVEKMHVPTESETLLALSYESQTLIQADEYWARVKQIADALYDNYYLDEEAISLLFLEEN